ncbi:MAG: DUF4301 family protein [Bacteroidetes bacterium]|nr:DUF4301 family protein [Bacteroidota bacterium]
MLKNNDIEFIKAKGISEAQLETHILNFKSGFPYSNLKSAATAGNGIIKFGNIEIKELVKYFNSESLGREIIKFVPASGAASRMFKHLFEFRDNPDTKQLNDDGFNSVGYFFKHLTEFAFYDDLSEIFESEGFNLSVSIQNKEYNKIIDLLLNAEGLQYASLPKGLLKFHNYNDGARLAIEEHLVEGAVYCKNDDNKVKIHFTVSPEHQEKSEVAIEKIKRKHEIAFDIQFEISFSIQKPSTDMIAVDMQNEPLRDANGDLVFRPGGHGALIENLNDIDGDIIFIKNIDNIVPDRLRETTYIYKKVIAAHLIKLQVQTFEYLTNLKNKAIPDKLLSEIEAFAKNKLFIDLSDKSINIDRAEYLFNKMNRPLRVCGMVINEGEPGGGPFWVFDQNGNQSLQIVENSQIDLKNQNQKKIVGDATHFNPVDLVCGVRDYQGNKFNLKNYVDHQTGFISIKSQNGKELKAQELPGLWNGAMANWITIFVECPILTFNPVKIINDLLREQHQ